jgi:hypothetical protein
MADDLADKAERQKKLEEHEKLLDRLDSDRELAWKKYAKIQSRLYKFFEWRGSLRSDEDADAVLDRVAEIVASGKKIEDILQFIPGVARKIFLEILRKEFAISSIEELPGDEDALPSPPKLVGIEEKIKEEKRLTCLDSCLDKLEREDRFLILLYHSAEEKGTKRARGERAKKNETNKEFRRYLAQFFGISVEALRVRACRIRGDVEKCVEGCLKSEGEVGASN